MSLVRESIDFARWLARIMRTFISVRPVTTLAVVAAAALSRITHLLASFLPLKVVLLAGSDGIPSYFAAFIDPADKLGWTIGLTIAAFASYATTLLLDAVSARLAEGGSQDVLQGANELAVVNNYREQAQGYYERFCEVLAGFLFALAGFAVLLLLNVWLVLFLSGAMILEFAFTARGVRRLRRPNPGRFGTFIQGSLGRYLKLLTSMNFLGGFLVLLYPHLMGAGGNILTALLSIIIMRQLFNALTAALRDSVTLAKNKPRINALVFRNHHLHRPERREGRALRILFSKSGRRQVVASELQRVTGREHSVDVCWTDTMIRGASVFRVKATNEGAGEAYYQLQVFSPKHVHRLENEDFLFSQMPRALLKAPQVVARFSRGPFECQLCEDEAGVGARAAAAVWRQRYPQLLEYYWSLRPPRSLVQAYKVSRPLLQQKLNSELLERVDVGVDTAEEAECLAAFTEQRPALQKLLAKLPLYVHNLDLAADNVVWNDGESWCVMCWGGWVLLPVGAVLPAKTEPDALVHMFERLRVSRSDIPSWLQMDHLWLANQCLRLEGAIRRENYKQALRLMHGILNNPVLGWPTLKAETA